PLLRFAPVQGVVRVLLPRVYARSHPNRDQRADRLFLMHRTGRVHGRPSIELMDRLFFCTGTPLRNLSDFQWPLQLRFGALSDLPVARIPETRFPFEETRRAATRTAVLIPSTIERD